jgi:hypothetical protein
VGSRGELEVAGRVRVGGHETELRPRAVADLRARPRAREVGLEARHVRLELEPVAARLVEAHVEAQNGDVHGHDPGQQDRDDRNPDDTAECRA